MNPECLIFDFGNVVAFLDHHRACRKLAELSGNGMDEKDIYAGIFRQGGMEEDYDCGRVTSQEFIQQIKKMVQIQCSDAEVEQAWCNIFWQNESIARLLAELHQKSYRLILASNTNELHYRWFKKEYAGILINFDVEILSYQLGYRKPDRLFYQNCLEKAKCPASSCIFIDDVPVNVAAAGNLGIFGIQYIPADDIIGRLRGAGIRI